MKVDETFETFISIGNLSLTTGGKLNFKLSDPRFEKCGAFKVRLRCVSEDGTETNKTVSGLEIDSRNINGTSCRALGYLDSENVKETFSARKWSPCFTSSGTSCEKLEWNVCFTTSRPGCETFEERIAVGLTGWSEHLWRGV